jgi:hypothetical protein
MRLEQFDEAVKYLSKVSKDYVKTLNIYEYFQHDPFSDPIKTRFIPPSPHYKLDFALRMSGLQRKMETARNKELRAEASFLYAWGLKRAITDCWALTAYYKYDYIYKSEGKTIPYWEKSMRKHSEKRMANVAKTTTNKELKAKCFLATNLWLANDDRERYEYKNGDWVNVPQSNSQLNENFNLFIANYSSTDIIKRFQSECDNFKSYCKASHSF